MITSLPLIIQAIEDIGNLALGKWNQMMVPVNEMTDVLRVVKDSASRNLRQGSWVRIKRGIYRDDIAQVTERGGREGLRVDEGEIEVALFI